MRLTSLSHIVLKVVFRPPRMLRSLPQFMTLQGQQYEPLGTLTTSLTTRLPAAYDLFHLADI